MRMLSARTRGVERIGRSKNNKQQHTPTRASGPDYDYDTTLPTVWAREETLLHYY